MKNYPSVSSLHPSMCTERGIFCLGNFAVDKMALNFIRQQTESNRHQKGCETIVVSGDGTQALCVLGRLEAYGVDPNRIVWIRTRDSEISEIEHDELNSLIELGLIGDEDDGKPHVTVHNNIDILDVQMGLPRGAESDEEEIIEGLSIRIFPPTGSVMGHKDEFLECCALICCSKEQCDVDVFNAINDSGLIFDGGIVVDECFRTVDRAIYAVGPMTKYSRRYRDQIPHSRCNAREMGTFVANDIISRHLVASEGGGGASTTDFGYHDSMVRAPSVENIRFHKFHLPRIIEGLFPGGIDFVVSSLPERKNCSKIDRYLMSGPKQDSSQRTCGVTFDALGVCCEIVCGQRLFTNTPSADKSIAVNIGPLVGWHESYLNSAMYAFECAQVVDWVDFLSGPWSEALRFDRFPTMCELIRKSLYSDKGMIAILDKIIETAELADDNLVVANARRNLLGDRGCLIDEGTKNVVVTHTLDFLRKNKIVFSNFYIPMPKGKGKKS